MVRGNQSNQQARGGTRCPISFCGLVRNKGKHKCETRGIRSGFWDQAQVYVTGTSRATAEIGLGWKVEKFAGSQQLVGFSTCGAYFNGVERLTFSWTGRTPELMIEGGLSPCTAQSKSANSLRSEGLREM